MKQKILFLCFSIIVSCMFAKAYAQTVEVRSLVQFSTDNPPKSITIELLEPVQISDTEVIKAGNIVKGNLVDVKDPKRLKRNAKFSFRPTSYIDEKGKTHVIKYEIKASYTEPVDKGKLAKSAALSVGNFFVKGAKAGAAVVEGTIKNEQGSRLKSAGHSLYESTPVSYIEEGLDLEISADDTFYLKFPNIKSDDDTNNTKKE